MDDGPEQQFRKDFLRMNKDQRTVVLILAMRYLEQLIIRAHAVNPDLIQIETQTPQQIH